MKTINKVVKNLTKEFKNNSLSTGELCKNSLFRLDYSGKIRYNYSEDRGEITMRKPESGGF